MSQRFSFYYDTINIIVGGLKRMKYKYRTFHFYATIHYQYLKHESDRYR